MKRSIGPLNKNTSRPISKPDTRCSVSASAAAREAFSFCPAPRYREIRMPAELENTRNTMDVITWLAALTPEAARSLYQLSMNTSTKPSIICRIASIRIGMVSFIHSGVFFSALMITSATFVCIKKPLAN